MRNLVLPPLFAALLSFSSFAVSADPAKPAVAPSVQMQQLAAPINLNTADAATLQAGLNGIGKAKAEAIIAYREQNGSFDSVDELLEIKGIGRLLLDRNRDKLSVN